MRKKQYLLHCCNKIVYKADFVLVVMLITLWKLFVYGFILLDIACKYSCCPTVRD